VAPPADESSPATVTVVLPNYNGAELLCRFMPSVMRAAAALEPPAAVLVVDDASTDSSVGVLHAEFPQATVLVNQRNLGFGATANRGIEAAGSSFVLLLNTDAEPAHDVLAPLLERLQGAPDVAAVVPKIVQVTTGGTCESVAFGAFRLGLFRLERRPDLCESEQPLPVLYPCGAAVMLRRDIVIDLGGFDRLFAPFYWEDVDLGYRMWRGGYRVLYEPRARVSHYHPGVIKTAHSERRAHFMQDRNRFLFMWKNLDLPLLLRHFAFLPAHVVVSALTGRGRFVTALASALPALPRSLLRRGTRGPAHLSSLEIFARARPEEGTPHVCA
jgi:GT2 family glycosyltransferase